MATAKKPERPYRDGTCIDCDEPLVPCDCAPGCIGSKCSSGCDDSLPHATEPPVTDESLIARNHALREALRNVLRLCVDRRGHAFADAQEALNVADALLVEEEGR